MAGEVPAFWAGMIDGDGSVTLAQHRARPKPNVILVGGEPIIAQYRAFLAARIYGPSGELPSITSERPVNDLFRITIGGIPAARLLYLIANASPTRLARKAKRATEVIEASGDYLLHRAWAKLVLEPTDRLTRTAAEAPSDSRDTVPSPWTGPTSIQLQLPASTDASSMPQPR